MKSFIEGLFGKKIFELAIILIGVILIAYIFGFWGKGSRGSFSLKNSNPSCGLFITSPTENNLISHSEITVKGYLNGCGWGSLSGVVGYVEVLDSTKMLLSNGKVTLYSANADLKKTTFSQNIPLVATPNTSTGEIVITSGAGSDGLKVVRVPIRFSSSVRSSVSDTGEIYSEVEQTTKEKNYTDSFGSQTVEYMGE
jgi:hypothetical protein